jgi:exportin-2 (importin alpha re-exporter)
VPGHHLRILHLIADPSVNIGIRQAAGIHFKNSVKKYWEDGDAQFPTDAKDVIRQNVVDLMCRVPESSLQELLSESISLIAKSDYPNHWQSLLPDLVQRFQSQCSDVAVLNGLLKTANSIFKAFRYVERSDDLYKVIIYTLGHIAEPISLLFFKICEELKTSGSTDPIRNDARLESLRLICRIFYSLNYQDLPEYYEDNMRPWMEEFGHFLTFTDRGSDPDESPNGMDKLQSAIIAVLDLYASRDEEPFQEYLPSFTKLVWELLNGRKPRHDTLTVASIQFLSSLIEKSAHRALFENPETIKLILVQIIIPNLTFRESDMEKFEDDPADFMLTEVEGSTSESRRRKAQICLKSLCKSFNDITVALVQEHVSLLLADFQRDPIKEWAKKDSAVRNNVLLVVLAVFHHTHPPYLFRST